MPQKVVVNWVQLLIVIAKILDAAVVGFTQFALDVKTQETS